MGNFWAQNQLENQFYEAFSELFIDNKLWVNMNVFTF